MSNEAGLEFFQLDMFSTKHKIRLWGVRIDCSYSTPFMFFVNTAIRDKFIENGSLSKYANVKLIAEKEPFIVEVG